MDHLMLWMPATTEGSGAFELECVASAPGLVETQNIAQSLRKTIEERCIGPVIKQLEVTAGTEEEFAEAWRTLDGKLEQASCRLAALFTHPGVRARSVLHGGATGGGASRPVRRRLTADPSPAPVTPPSAAAAPEKAAPMTMEALFRAGLGAAAAAPPAAAAYASVLRCGGPPGTGWRGLAKEAEQLFSCLSDSFKSPGLDSAKILQIAQSSLVLLRAVVPALSALAGAVDTTMRLVQDHGSHGLAGEIREVLLNLRLPSMAAADGAAPAARAASSKPRRRRPIGSKWKRGAPVAQEEVKPPTMAEMIARLAEAVLLDGPDRPPPAVPAGGSRSHTQ